MRSEGPGIVPHRLRRLAIGPNKSATHAFTRAEAGLLGHDVDREPALLKHQLCGFEPQILDCLCWRYAGLGTKYAGELPRTQACHPREIFYAQWHVQVALGMRQRRLNSISLGVEIQQCGMLGLPSSAPMVDHHPLGHGTRQSRRCSALALRRSHDFQCAQEFACKGGRYLVAVLGIDGLRHLVFSMRGTWASRWPQSRTVSGTWCSVCAAHGLRGGRNREGR
jgi:hypothetical protein